MTNRTVSAEQGLIDAWLRARSAVYDPFVITQSDLEDPQRTISLPNRWDLDRPRPPDSRDRFLTPESILFTSNTAWDRKVATLLLMQLSNADPVRAFPVYLSLPSQYVKSQLGWQTTLPDAQDSTNAEFLCAIASSAAETWCRLVSSRPDAFLDLPSVDQRQLFALLAWNLGAKASVPEHIEGVQAANMSSDGATDTGNELGDELLDVLRDFAGEAESGDAPGTRRLMQWLSLRPLGLRQTFVIACCKEAKEDDEESRLSSQASALLALTYPFADIKLSFKVFAPTRAINSVAHVANDKVDVLIWTHKALLTTINTRISLSTKGGYGGLDGWFSLGTPDPIKDSIDKLITASNGSLHRFLWLCRQTVIAAAKREPDADLTEQDVEHALQGLTAA